MGLGLQRGSCSEQAWRRGRSLSLFSVRAHFRMTLDIQRPLHPARSFKMANVFLFWHWKVSVSYLKISLMRNPLIFLWYKTGKVYQLARVEFKSVLTVWSLRMLAFFPEVSAQVLNGTSSWQFSGISVTTLRHTSYFNRVPRLLNDLSTYIRDRQAIDFWDKEQLYSQGGNDTISL